LKKAAYNFPIRNSAAIKKMPSKGEFVMPSGGARKGAGRKPKPLAEKLATGNPGHRPLKKMEFTGKGSTRRPEPPEYLNLLEKKTKGLPLPTEIFMDTVQYLEPSECLNLISTELIADYAMAKYYLICAQYELSRTATVSKNDKNEYAVTSFTEAMLKMQKNVLQTWQPIWDIVSRNSERLITNPEQDLFAMIVGGRARKRKPKGEAEDGYAQYAENSDIGIESGEI
jgi:hypothetical protein